MSKVFLAMSDVFLAMFWGVFGIFGQVLLNLCGQPYLTRKGVHKMPKFEIESFWNRLGVELWPNYCPQTQKLNSYRSRGLEVM